MKRRFRIAFGLICVECGCATGEEAVRLDSTVASAGVIAIENAFAPEPVTGDAGSLYFTVRNDGDGSDFLISVDVDLAADVSLHDQLLSGGSMQMIGVDSIEVPPHGSVSLEPGAYHVMLRELSRHYRDGETLSVSVHFTHAGTVRFQVPVISYADVADRMDGAREPAERQ